MTELDQARAVADAVLYEGYLLYPYRASATKNQVRWQFGVLGPPAAEPGIGEPAAMTTEFLLTVPDDPATDQLTIYLRFLQLQARQLFDRTGAAVSELQLADRTLLSWEEAVPHELVVAAGSVADLHRERSFAIEVAGGSDREELAAGAQLRIRRALRAELTLGLIEDGPVRRLRIAVRNLTELAEPAAREAAIARSLIGCHLLLQATGSRFVSLLEPPAEAAEPAGRCRAERCWPVLAGPSEQLLLVSPIILYDHPQIAEQSAGALFDSTEIDEILTLRVLTMTDAEKAEARATDPEAAAIIDRCEAMSAADLQQLHGILRDPRSGGAVAGRLGDPADWQIPSLQTPADSTDPAGPAAGGQPWWDPGVDASVSPETDTVLIGSTPVGKGSRVRVRPSRRADAQDLFFDGRLARVTGVFADVDGNSHVAVVLIDDPAADLHEWYGRYLYFAPDEIEALPVQPDRATLGDSPDSERRGEQWQLWEG